METVGNIGLLGSQKKVAFLSSRKIAPDDVLRCYDWAAKMRDSDACIMSGFQSPLEKDVLRFLLRGKVPDELRDALDSGRLLIVSPVSAARVSASTAAARNRWILENCDSIYVGALDPAGRLGRQISQSRKESLI